jgi:HEAT repeat protein
MLGGVLTGDIDKDVRLAAARALGHTKHPTAVAALGDVLEDDDPAMQVRAVKSLRKITGEDLGNDVNRWRQYVKRELPQPDNPTSIAERLRRLF